MTETAQPPERPALPSAPLAAGMTDAQRKARFGPAYLRAVCGQAGAGFLETSPDEDLYAVDGYVRFDPGLVAVQVKTTSRWSLPGGDMTWRLEDRWLRSWSALTIPVYLVVVVVPRDPESWLRHEPDGTFLSTAAFWARIRPDHGARSITVRRRDRLTVETVHSWLEDLLELVTPRSA